MLAIKAIPRLFGATFLIASACHTTPERSVPASKAAGTHVAVNAPGAPLTPAELPTTDGGLALHNLDAEIAGLEAALEKDPTLDRISGLAENLEARGQFLGRLADYDSALALADRAVALFATDGRAFVARAKARAIFHRFVDATGDLDHAEMLGVAPAALLGQRASILQALGLYDEALAIRHRMTEQKGDLSSMGNEAAVLADMGETDKAEQLFVEAQHHFRDVAPFPVAWLYFQEATMWERAGKVRRARALFEAASERVPGYAHAISHLASLEPPEHAMALLQPVVVASGDPEYEAQLGRLLREQGRAQEGAALLAHARHGLDERTTRHPEAFADHAARFWLADGDAKKALGFAEANLAVRPTRDALTLVIDAAIEAHEPIVACGAAERALSLPNRSTATHMLAARALDACGRNDEADRERQVALATR